MKGAEVGRDDTGLPGGGMGGHWDGTTGFLIIFFTERWNGCISSG